MLADTVQLRMIGKARIKQPISMIIQYGIRAG